MTYVIHVLLSFPDSCVAKQIVYCEDEKIKINLRMSVSLLPFCQCHVSRNICSVFFQQRREHSYVIRTVINHLLTTGAKHSSRISLC